jgi:hypothetical protein
VSSFQPLLRLIKSDSKFLEEANYLAFSGNKVPAVRCNLLLSKEKSKRISSSIRAS